MSKDAAILAAAIPSSDFISGSGEILLDYSLQSGEARLALTLEGICGFNILKTIFPHLFVY